MAKYISYFFGLLFLYFAYVQFNDPDPAKWVTIYILTALLPIAYLYWSKVKYGIYALIAVLILLFILAVPDFINWAKDGFPSITETMKAESPYVELVREFLGIFICLIYLGSVLFLGRKKSLSGKFYH